MPPQVKAPVQGEGGRIPKTLQAVFLASNRGNEVVKPPPKQVAFKVFFRSLMGKKPKNGGVDDNADAAAAAAAAEKSEGQSKKKKKSNSSKKEKSGEEKLADSIEASYKKKSSSSKNKPPKPEKKIEDPQMYLDQFMRQRGYCTKRYNTLKTAYHNKPTPLQRASYDLHLIGIVKSGEAEDLDDILRSGISPNPCNSYGESLVHMVCRRGDEKLLQIMIQNGCDIQVADDYGRTPLHDACWAAEPAFEAVQMLLDQDPTLLQMTDCRGFLPLSYVRKDHWPQWITFFNSKKDVYWPNLLQSVESSMHSTISTVCEFVEQNPNTRPLVDPKNALPLDLANMVASGAIKPEEAIYLRNLRMSKKTNENGEVIDDDDDDDDDESDSDDDYDSDEDSDDDDDDEDGDEADDQSDGFTDAEMEELLGTLTIQLGGAPPKMPVQ